MKKSASRVWLIIIGLALCCAVGWLLLSKHRPNDESTVSLTQLIGEIRRDVISSAIVSGQEVTARYKASSKRIKTTLPASFPELFRIAEEHKVDLIVDASGRGFWSRLAGALGPGLQLVIVLLLIMLLMAVRQGGPESRTREFISTEKFLQKDELKRLTFDDIGGSESAKAALQVIVNYLRDPGSFKKLDAAPPRGILLVGPPGTGKTLLAKVVAAQAGRPFFAASGSAFVELFVGVGASRIRDLFDRARKNTPCVIFIDELDAFARRRSTADVASNREQDQALNELLTQMDGFSDRSGIVVIGATNRPDVLDPAVVRIGRFDRQITVPLPDFPVREKILGIHLQRKRELGVLQPEVSNVELASQTEGFSGADLAGLVNSAALAAASKGKEIISAEDFAQCLEELYPPDARLDALESVIDTFIIGQKGAKAALLGTVQLHYSSIRAASLNGVAGQKKPCLLLLGERGTQKTTLVRKAAAHLGVVFYTCSASELTRPDNYGRDGVQLLLRNIIAAADGNVKRAERAIVCISGIERLLGFGARRNSEDMHANLARLIRGGVFEVPLISPVLNPDVRQMNSTRLLIFLTGHLPDVENMVRRRYAHRDYVTMKRLVNDEQAELLNLGWSDDLMDVISTVSVCSPLTEADYVAILSKGDGAHYISEFQATLRARGVPIMLSDHINRIAERVRERGEGVGGISNTLRDLCAHVLSVPGSGRVTALDEYLGIPQQSGIYDDHYLDVDPFVVLAELPSDLGAVIAKNQLQSSGCVVLIELPHKVSSADTNLHKILPWLHDRMVNCVNIAERPFQTYEVFATRLSQHGVIHHLENTLKRLEDMSAQLPPALSAREAVDRVVKCLQAGQIDQLRGLVLLHGIAVRLNCAPVRRLLPTTAFLLQAVRAAAMLDLVKIGYELRGGVRDELGLGATVAGLATALSDGLLEVEGEGLSVGDTDAENQTIDPERVSEALTVTPDLKRAICDIVGSLRESLDLPAADLDGIRARSEWILCKPQLQRRGDIRNTPNLMRLLAAVDSCVKALGSANNKELFLLIDAITGHVVGRGDRAHERLHYWRSQIEGLQRLLTGEKTRETFTCWRRFDFDPELLDAEVRNMSAINAKSGTAIGSSVNWTSIMEMVDEYYTALESEAIAMCEKHLGAEQNGHMAGIVVNEFDAEAIMDHCTKTNVSFLTVIPAIK